MNVTQKLKLQRHGVEIQRSPTGAILLTSPLRHTRLSNDSPCHTRNKDTNYTDDGGNHENVTHNVERPTCANALYY